VPFIEVRDLVKTFRPPGSVPVRAVDDVSVSADDGQMLVLLGESGSGKTTLLRCIAGLEQADVGEIRIGGRLVFSSKEHKNEPPRARQLGMVFQGYALWPHMTAGENVSYPLAVRGIRPRERTERAARYLELVGCTHLAGRYPHELSGGQQQRIALGRALAYEPALVLFDEPLSSLDAGLREELRLQIRDLKRQLKFTGVYVTHDQTEAFFLGDKIAILASGRLLQLGSPREVYSRPATPIVARFLGCTNVMKGIVTKQNGTWSFRTLETEGFDLSGAVWSGDPGAGTGIICARPDATLVLPVDGAPVPGRMYGAIDDRMDLAGQVEYVIRLKSGRNWRSRIGAGHDVLRAGAAVEVVVRPGQLFMYAIPTDAAAAIEYSQ
jgi:iron(III) transport system ATP-binding protein